MILHKSPLYARTVLLFKRLFKGETAGVTHLLSQTRPATWEGMNEELVIQWGFPVLCFFKKSATSCKLFSEEI